MKRTAKSFLRDLNKQIELFYKAKLHFAVGFFFVSVGTAKIK